VLTQVLQLLIMHGMNCVQVPLLLLLVCVCVYVCACERERGGISETTPTPSSQALFHHFHSVFNASRSKENFLTYILILH
jgi:hypothetical protein